MAAATTISALHAQPHLLVRGDPLLVLVLRLDVLDGVRALDLEGDGLAGQGLDKDLHLGVLFP